MPEIDPGFQKDIDDISQMAIVPTLLNVICQTTGMRFAAIARVTEDKWITCSVKDDILFGLKPGDELEVKSTLCHEVRQYDKLIVIDNVLKDPVYHNHHTPAKYGLQSYISVPIIRRNGSFFGTLCAIDPAPNKLNTPVVIGMFTLYAELISFHLNSIEQIDSYIQDIQKQKIFSDMLERKVQERTEQLNKQNISLEKLNHELETFTLISSHDLQEPLRKIQNFAHKISETEKEKISETGKENLEKLLQAAGRMRTLIDDLLRYSNTKNDENKFEHIGIEKLLAEVKEDLAENLEQKKAVIELSGSDTLNIIPVQFRQLLYNIIANSLKFSQTGIPVNIQISVQKIIASSVNNKDLVQGKEYHHIRIADNGIGFDQQYSGQLFGLFQKLHPATKFSGNGIGLTIVKRIVENHQGIITARGEPNEGAAFDIFIPSS